jgi:transcription initiation factor TFIIH subunit 2
MSFRRLVRYVNAEGKTKYGDLKKAPGPESLEGAEVDILDGDLVSGFKRTGKSDKIEKACHGD